MKQEFKIKNLNHLICSKNNIKHVSDSFWIDHNKGITLIALIITIIVLLILSAVTITSIKKGNILKHAQDAKENYSIAEEKERVTLAVHQGILEGKGTINKAGVTSGMNSQFPNNGWEEVNWDESEEYVRVLIKASKRQYKITLDTGKIENEKYPGLKIGDKVNYTASGYTGDWRVLDIDGNQVKLVAASNTEKFEIPMSDTSLLVWDDTSERYKVLEKHLDEICEKYMNETYATSARSIKIEDIDKITRYDKTQYGKGELNQYGNKVTYTITENSNNKVTEVRYESIVKTGKALAAPYNFRKPLAGLNSNITEPYEITSSYYTYSLDGINYTDKTSNIYKILFGNAQDETTAYWLASSCVFPKDYGVLYHLLRIQHEAVNAYIVWDSNAQGEPEDFRSSGMSSSGGIRPVVTLKSDIKLTQTSENSGEWNISK